MQKTTNWIPVAFASITEREGDLAREAAMNAWGPDHYAYNRRFEEMFAAFVGTKHAVSLPHCTAAIHLALAANNIGPGDEVIVPDVTWIASASPVTYVGANPVFADILPDTWCIDPQSVEAAITPRTRAIIGVDLYGSMCDWDALKAISSRHNLVLIEDAAEAIGSQYRGQRAGSFGVAAAFSFHGSKTVTTGEGGMLTTNDDATYARVLHLRDHGRPPNDRSFQNTEIGFKYKMSAVQAALGIAQMERVDELVAYKRKIFGWYAERLKGLNGIQLNCEPGGTSNCYWMTTIVLSPDYELNKFAMQEQLRKQNIDSRPFFSRLSTLQAYRNMPESWRFLPAEPVGNHAGTYGINLPSGSNMTEQKVDMVCAAVWDILSEASSR